MSDVIIYQGAAIPFSFSRQNGQPLDVTSVMRTLADITTYAANTEKKYVPYEGQTIACLEDKMLYILELKNGVLVPKLSGGVKLIKRDDNVELTDDAALSALRSVKEIEERAISRTKRDTAAEVIEFAKGLTAGSGKTTVSGDGKITTLNLLIQALAEMYDLNVSHVATMMRTIIKDYLSSEAFTPGLTGEGFKISKALNGDWNLEIDNIVVRKVMTIFEMIISKVRSINGGLVISSANGRIKSAAETTGSPAYYVIGIEGDMQFVVDDYVRCQVFSNGHAKFYWVRVSSISNNSILVLKSEFTNGAVPAIGDDLVQMGNATNTARQGLIYLTASEDGKPRISVMDGVNSTSTVGKNKVILGCLDGITDTDFPADFQPSGYGLYAMNVFLKGIFVLRNGKSVEGEIEAAQNAASVAQAKADTVTRLFQEFTVAGGLFESKITETKTYADSKAKEAKDAANAYADGKVDGLQVGGRNYYKKNTPYDPQATQAKFERLVSINGFQLTGAQDVNSSIIRLLQILTSNGYWTVSFEFCGTQNVPVGFYIDVCDTGRKYFQNPSTTNEYLRVEHTVNITNYSSSVYHFVDFESITWTYITIRNFKVEKGNKATDWTLAPEDVAADAKAKADAAQAAAEAVAISKAALAKTEASAYADGIVTAEERRAIADAQAKLAEAKLDAQAKADAAKQAAINDAAGKYPTKTEVSTSITQLSNSISLKANQTEVTGLDNRLSSAEAKITPDAIRLTVSEQTKNIAIEYANLAAKLAGAKMLYRDPTFKIGLNGIGVYNNLGNGTVGISRLSRDPNNPTDSNYQLVITSTGYSQTPGRGGFYFSNYVHIYGEYICKIIAWIPVGSNLCFASNSIGDSGYQKWLTPTAGQGKWAEYVSYVRGGSGNTSSTNFYYLDAGAETLQWWLCYATVFECSSAEDTPTRSEVSAELDILSTEIRAKVSNDTFNALGNRVSAAEATLTVQANQIASKVSQNDFNTLGQRVGSAESAITQQATQITAQVTAVNDLTGRVSSAELALNPDNIWLGIKNNVAASIPLYTTQVDTRSLDPNKYYLVTMNMATTIPYTITVERALSGNYGVPPYSAHTSGFSVICKWQSNGSGWGGSNIKRIIQTLEYRFVGSCPVGSIGQISESSQEYVYVRGGSVYNIRVEGTSSTTVVLHTSEYLPYPDYPNSRRPSPIESVVTPIVDLDQKVTEEQVKTGISIAPGIINVFGKQISLAGAVTFSSMASDAQGKINDAQNAANAAGAAAGTAKNTADKAITDAANSLVTSRNNIAAQLGYGSYDAMSAAAIAGKTIINGGKIRTELLDATAIVTGALVSSVISATNITTGRLTVTDGAKIGGMVIENNVLKGGSISLNDGAKIGDLYVIGGAFSSLDTNIIPPGTSWFSMSKDFLAYNYYNRYDYSTSSCRVSGDGITIDKGLVTINNGGLTVKRPTGIALDVQGSIITRDSSGNMNTGRTFKIAFFDAWVGGQGKQIELTVTNGIITGWRFF